MLHFSCLRNESKRQPVFLGIILLVFLIGINTLMVTAGYCQTDERAQLTAVIGQVKDTKVELRIKGTQPLTYTVYELFKPSRLVVDIADVDISSDLYIQVPQEEQITVKTAKVAESTTPLTRVEFILPDAYPFKDRVEANDIVFTLHKTVPDNDSAAADELLETIPTIDDIKVVTSPESTKIILTANGPLSDYRYDVLDRTGDTPPRLYIDLNNINVGAVAKEQLVGSSVSKIRVAKRGSGLRVVFDSAMDEMFPFEIQENANGLEVNVSEPSGGDQLSNLIAEKKSIESQLPDVDPLQKSMSPIATEQRMKDAFTFSGYTKERITVDFYKIDLHNVFRLFRDVSGINIVVDEEVSGSLTLALDDVPWDFALDIILNLKDLEKQERFNTLVILPKGKEYNWPQQAQNNLSFEADIEVVEQEALLISQLQKQPVHITKAKERISRGMQFEKSEDFETALGLYEEALKAWPENAKLANRIASIYLLYLRQNAKALYFAQKALDSDPTITEASLNAAIASASMSENSKAIEYFDQSVSVPKPSKEALLSFASFSEGQGEYVGSIKLLQKHNALYGQSLNSMVALARIYDKTGERMKATEEYQKILLAGFRIPPDLVKFIKGRVALQQSM